MESNWRSSSIIDTSESPGNLHKVAIIPPSWKGGPRPGDLIFDANFECGNLGRVDYICENEYDLFIRPDTANSRFRVWFYFTVENTTMKQSVILNIVNFSKSKSLYREGMAPMVFSTSRPHWQRIPTKHSFYYRCPDHKKNYVMTFVFCFDNPKDKYSFAYCYPYTYRDLQYFLERLEELELPCLRRTALELSTNQKRTIDLLIIAAPSLFHGTNEKHVVFLTARIHPGETPSSFVMEGAIKFLVSNDPRARLLREHVIFKIIPMMNPDGVCLGNYRCSLPGVDLNRVWQDPLKNIHPELWAAKQLVLNGPPTHKPDFYIDIHAHSTLMNGFMYGNAYEDGKKASQHGILPKLLCDQAEDFSLTNTSFNRDAIKLGTGRRTLGGVLDEKCHCYTLEKTVIDY
ncbi:hypothetical protein SNEBB_011243 [Seison nebaliae]|nr:hypothetical protein SNEBB_011243 [Seison nebaliae]